MKLFTQIRDILSAQKRMSLMALAKACHSTSEEVEACLCFYEHKGCVRKKNLRLHCSTSCQQCDLSSLVVYEWV